jgi:murein DD-endopeptidase MepM/ murein hydrolase activator NlpD
MTIRRSLTAALPPLLIALIALMLASVADATATVNPSETGASASGTTTVPAPPSEPAPSEPVPSEPGPSEPASPRTTTSMTPNPNTTPAPTTTTTTTTTTTEATPAPAPEVRTQRSQPRTAVPTHTSNSAAQQPAQAPTGAKAATPSALTPPLPSTLSASSFSGVPSFFINSFSIPPFLLPIYQAAGAAYGIPWQVLAAINEVETDYGRDLSVSSAGAEGWMQFLPSEWEQYGVDVNDNGFEDPYNPADAIFAAARYLKGAGGDTDIRAAVFSYNHSQAYVNSVMLRAQLLGGTPPELLGAITGLTEGRFPVYAASHYSDDFPTTEGPSPHTVAGTTIYSQAGAPVIAAQDGRITQISQSGPLGPGISLTDAYGNTYIYSGLGTLATLYPVLEAVEADPSTPPTARAHKSSLSGARPGVSPSSQALRGATRVFRAGSDNVYLHSLRVGVQVIAGTVLGHVGSGVEPHIVFQIRPAGIGAPLIDPKPILDSWVKLQSSSVLKAKGRDPFAKISPTPGQALLESKTQLEQQVPRDRGIQLASCERRLIEDGQVDRRVLAALAFLSASGLQPTVSSHSCPRASAADHGTSTVGTVSAAVDISAVNGVSVLAGLGESNSIITAVRKLDELQGIMKPLQIASSTPLPGVAGSVSLPGYAGLIHVAFTPPPGGDAHAAGVLSSGLSPAQWLALVARLGEVPDPVVSSKPSSAAIPDHSSPASASAAEGN